MVTSIPRFFFFGHIQLKVRMFVIASIMACYGLFLYEVIPEYVLNPVYSSYYFVIPFVASVFTGIFLPRILPKNTNQSEDQNLGITTDTLSAVDSISLEQTAIQDNSFTTENSLISNTNSVPEKPEIQTSSYAATASNLMPERSTTDEALHEIIDKKIEPVGNEISKIKTDTSVLKEDISTLKTSIEDMFSKFENTMIDLKSLQAEISNPLNFIQKNTDLENKKDSSELTIPVIEHAYISPKYIFKDDVIEPDTKLNLQGDRVNRPVNELNQNSKDLYNFKQMFSGNLTLGKLMEIILLVSEIMQKLGDDSVNLLVQQCKMMGLKSEVEDTIRSIANMLSKSGVSVNDTLIMMYEFAQIVGVTDKDADRFYIKLMTDKTKNHSNPTKKTLKDGVN